MSYVMEMLEQKLKETIAYIERKQCQILEEQRRLQERQRDLDTLIATRDEMQKKKAELEDSIAVIAGTLTQ